MVTIVGERFHPTDEELINHYLFHKILGNDSLVENAISETNIYNFDPWQLPRQSKIQSSDLVWYFFCPRNNKYSNSKRMNRTTSSGYWKATGIDRQIRAKSGNRDVIGTKKTLVFYLGRVPNGQRTSWVMHEYLPSLLPADQMMYVICKIKDKSGEYTGVPSGNANEPSHSLASDSNNLAANNTTFEVSQPIEETPESFWGLSDYELAVQLSEQEGLLLSELDFVNEIASNPNPNLQQPIDQLAEDDQAFLGGLEHVDPKWVEDLFVDLDEVSCRKSLHEHCNDYRPPTSLTGVYVDYGSESEAETICAMSHQEISSPVDSVGSSNQIRAHVFHGDEVLALGTSNNGGSPRTQESSVSSKSRKAQFLPKNVTNVAQEHPTQLWLHGKVTHAAPPKDKGKTVVEPCAAMESSKMKKSFNQKKSEEWKMAQETNIKTSLSNGKEKGPFTFLETAEMIHKPNLPSVCILNVIVGLILFLFVVWEMVFIH